MECHVDFFLFSLIILFNKYEHYISLMEMIFLKHFQQK